MTTQSKDKTRLKCYKVIPTEYSRNMYICDLVYSSGSDCSAGLGIHSVLTSFWALGLHCVSVTSCIRSVQVLVKSRSCVSSVIHLFVSWMQFVFYYL